MSPPANLALPLGELSPQVTERVLSVTSSVYPLRPRFARPPLPRGEARKAPRLALPLGELSPQATERVLQSPTAFTLSDLASLGHLSQRERQGGMRKKASSDAYLPVFAGKIQENRRGFLGRFKGAPGGNSQSPRAPNRKPAQRLRFGKEEMSTEDKRRRSRRLVPSWSFLTRQRFLLEKQKKMLDRSCKSVEDFQPFTRQKSNFIPSHRPR